MNKPTIQDALEWLRADRDDYTDEWDRACIARAIGALMTAESVIPKLEAINAKLQERVTGQFKHLRELQNEILGTDATSTGYAQRKALSEIKRLKSINAELLAACEAYVRLIGNCGDPTQYSGSFANLLAAIEKAKQ